MIPSRPSPRRSRRAVAAALLALSVLAGGTAFAASLTVTSSKLTGWSSATSVVCTPSTATASADADSYADQDNASSNFGSSPILKVRAQLPVLGIGGNSRALVRFTLPPTPDLCSVTLAKLRLYASSSDSGRTLQALRVNASWVESGTGSVTWNNQPATTGTAVTTSSGTGYREWTVTSQVTSMYSGSNNGFLVRDSAESPALGSPEQQFNSRTAAGNQPELVITFG